MSEQTSERERLIAHLLLSEEYLGSVSDDTVAMLRADAEEIAALRQRVEACDTQLGEARATIDALRGRCRAAEAYALSLAEKVDEMEAHSEALAHSTPAPVVTGGKGE